MRDEVIAAATEELLNITRDYYKDLSGFIEHINGEIDDLNDKMLDIGRNWNDANFTAFKKSVDEKIRELNDQVERAKQLLDIVAETEKGFARALDILNG